MAEVELKSLKPVWLDDKLVRMIGIPFFGIVIPSATGLIDVSTGSPWTALLSYLYFILIAGIVWEGNRWLLFRYYPLFFAGNSAIQKYVLIIGLNILYTAPLSMAMLLLWKWVGGMDTIGRNTLLITTAVIVVCVIFVTNVYEKVLFAKHSDQEKMKMEQLQHAKVQAELDALKNQVDPHFIFNTLNSLSFLVEHDADKAQKFIDNLANVYRYILQSKDRDLVLLRDEMAFLQAYATLMTLRHEDAFRMKLNIDKSSRTHYLIPPISLMVAIENAVKHNEVSKTNPLIIEVKQDGHQISVSNRIVPRRFPYESTKVGLQNLNDRFEKTLGAAISIVESDHDFTLVLPLSTVS